MRPRAGATTDGEGDRIGPCRGPIRRPWEGCPGRLSRAPHPDHGNRPARRSPAYRRHLAPDVSRLLGAAPATVEIARHSQKKLGAAPKRSRSASIGRTGWRGGQSRANPSRHEFWPSARRFVAPTPVPPSTMTSWVVGADDFRGGPTYQVDRAPRHRARRLAPRERSVDRGVRTRRTFRLFRKVPEYSGSKSWIDRGASLCAPFHGMPILIPADVPDRRTRGPARDRGEP